MIRVTKSRAGICASGYRLDCGPGWPRSEAWEHLGAALRCRPAGAGGCYDPSCRRQPHIGRRMGAAMCNDYGNHIPYSAYLEAFSQLKIRLFAPGGPPNLQPRDDIWPTNAAPIIRAAEDGAELVQLRWGFPAARPKGPPVINMRS